LTDALDGGNIYQAINRIPPLDRRRRRKGRTTSSDGERISGMDNRTQYTIAISTVVVCILVVGVALTVLLLGGGALTQGSDSPMPEWVHEIVERFQPRHYALSMIVTPPGAGTISSNLEDASAEPGTEILLSAVAHENYAFHHWEGDVEGTLPLVSLTLDSDKTVIARFVPASFRWDESDLGSLPYYDSGVQIWYATWFTDTVGQHQAHEGLVFLVVDLAIQNSGTLPFSTNQLNFRAVVGETAHAPAWYVLPDSLPARELKNRERVAGRLLFELPASAESGQFTLMYESTKDYRIDWIATD